MPHNRLKVRLKLLLSEKPQRSTTSPYTVHLHVFHWSGAERYPLSAAVDTWRRYCGHFHNVSTLLLEFMPDDRLSSLREEVQALKEIVR